MEEKEIWKDIVGYEGLYEVSNLARVRSVGKYVRGGNNVRYIPPHIKQQSINPYGYYYVILYKNNISKTCMVHILVAKAFIPNPNNRTEIDHIDGNGLNNVVSNLRWCTHSENNMNPIARKRQSESHLGKQMTTLWKPVVCISKDGTVTHYKSMSDAGKDGFGRSSIIDSIKHPDRPVRKRRWMYLYDFEKSLVNQ